MPDIAGRLPFGLGRLFGQPGPGNPSFLDGTIFPTVDVEGILPERAYLRGERRYHGSADVTGGAGQNGAVAVQLAFGTNSLIIVERIYITAIAAVTQVNLYLLQQGILGTNTNVIGTDTRQGLTTASLGTALFQFTTNWVAPGSGLFARYRCPVDTLIEINEPIVLAPPPTAAAGHVVLMVHDSTVAHRMFVDMVWRERPIAAGELTV